MNKKQGIFICLLFLIALPSIVAYNTPSDALKAYFEADKEEDIDAMMDLTDFSFVSDSEKEEFIQQTQLSMEELARTFDTKSYELTITQVIEQEDDALIFYHLTAELTDTTGATSTTDEDFVAVLHNDNGWKITSMQLQGNFEQNMLFREATKSVGKNAETLPLESQEQEETSSESSLLTSSLSELLLSLGKSLLEWIVNLLQTNS